jgi:hypothetical protein
MDNSKVSFYEDIFLNDMIRAVLIIMIKFPNYIFGIITELVKSQELMRNLVYKINHSAYQSFLPKLTQRNGGYVGVSMSFWKLWIHQYLCPEFFPQNNSSPSAKAYIITITDNLELLLKDLLGRRSLMEQYNLHN